jgi:ammonium transporter, Amt family
MDQVQPGADVFFLLMGAILVFAMHGGFAFLEVGTVRHKNQVNALVKILVDFAISTLVYFGIGYTLSYGVSFLANAEAISGGQGLDLVKFFFLATFAAAVPAIISGGIAERARFVPQCVATGLMVALAYPVIEGVIWNKNFGLQDNLFAVTLGAPFKDFAGSIVVHAFGGWAALAAVRQLGARIGRYDRGRPISPPPSSIPWLAMGSWLLCIGWFGFNVMSAQSLKGISGLVAALCTTVRSLVWSRCVRAPMSCIRLARPQQVSWQASSLFRCSRSRPTSGRSMTCSACGRCTGYAACGAALHAASSD